MRFKAPKGVTTVSVGGDTYNVGKGGTLEVPDEKNVVALLAPHGIMPVDDARQAQADIQADTQADATDAPDAGQVTEPAGDQPAADAAPAGK